MQLADRVAKTSPDAWIAYGTVAIITAVVIAVINWYQSRDLARNAGEGWVRHVALPMARGQGWIVSALIVLAAAGCFAQAFWKD